MRKPVLLLAILVGAGGLAVSTVFLARNAEAQFVAGGALVNLGYRLQDPLEEFDLSNREEISPNEVWHELLRQNRMAASVRARFPRTARHPIVAMVVCMDARIDTSELIGDTRKYYYIVRTAGSVLSEKEEEMLELSVSKGVKVILLTRHTDCAAEKVAADPEQCARFPNLCAAVKEQPARIRELLSRPTIREKIASGELLVKRIAIDTPTDGIKPMD